MIKYLIEPFSWLWEHSAPPAPVREAEKLARVAQRALRTHCKNGHPYTEDNYTGARYCRVCENERHQKRRVKP